jgi:hypothetical protein
MRKYKNCYGSFSSYNNQIVKDKIIFEKSTRLLNMICDGTDIKILLPGVYLINIIAHLQEEGSLGITINDNLLEETIKKTNKITNNIFVHEIVKIKENDKLSVKNINEKELIIKPIGDKYSNQSIDLTIYKIG